VRFRNGIRSLLTVTVLGIAIDAAQQTAETPQAPKSFVLANDKLALTIDSNGARLSRVTMKDGAPMSPLASMGHFLALDGFGAPSAAEASAGMPFHGEASHQTFRIVVSSDSAKSHLLTIQATLPLAQETLTRTAEIVDGENLVYITSLLESMLSVDRPVSWAEHATIGPPYLEKGKVVVDMPATKCRVRPYKPGGIPGHLVYGKDFTWPMAPVVGGGEADIREIPTGHDWLDLASCEMDPGRRLAFVTALHTEKHLLYGYVFRRMARGPERRAPDRFSTTDEQNPRDQARLVQAMNIVSGWS